MVEKGPVSYVTFAVRGKQDKVMYDGLFYHQLLYLFRSRWSEGFQTPSPLTVPLP